jgi:hypothetical protein
MRGQAFSYALVAFALTAHAAPLIARNGDVLPARGFNTGKVSVVAVGQEFERRQAAKASSTTKAAAGGAKATAPADLPGW